jgi:hypothetical protein
LRVIEQTKVVSSGDVDNLCGLDMTEHTSPTPHQPATFLLERVNNA